VDWTAAGNVCAVRINAAGTPWHDADLAALAKYTCAVMLPKAQDPDDVRRVADIVGDPGVIALIETARGAENCASIPTNSSAWPMHCGRAPKNVRGPSRWSPQPGAIGALEANRGCSRRREEVRS
jgi:citrate lyase beta subunit